MTSVYILRHGACNDPMDDIFAIFSSQANADDAGKALPCGGNCDPPWHKCVSIEEMQVDVGIETAAERGRV